MRPIPFTPARRRRLLLVGGLSFSFALAGAASAQVPLASPWRAGEPDRITLALADGQRTSLVARARLLAGVLGLHGLPGAPRRERDRFLERTLDTIEFSADGRTTAAIVLDAADGRVRAASDLTWQADMERPRVDARSAPGVAMRLAGAAGLSIPGAAPTETAWDAPMQAWRVRWERQVGAVPVPGDGLTVWLHPDGSFSGLSHVERPLAPAPEGPIDPARATTAARAYLAAHDLARLGPVRIDPPRLIWAAGNAFVDARHGDAPDATLRLAWLVGLSYTPPGWSEPHRVELYVDTASGELMGGDETA